MSELASSRIEDGRRRAASVKKSIGAAAVAAFLAAVGLAWASHSGTASSSGATRGFGTGDDSDPAFDDGFDFGRGSFAPSGTAVPQVQSGVS